MSQTVVDFLFEKLWETPKDKLEWYAIREQANQVFKDNIENAHFEGQSLFDSYPPNAKWLTGRSEKYYKEVYECEGSSGTAISFKAQIKIIKKPPYLDKKGRPIWVTSFFDENSGFVNIFIFNENIDVIFIFDKLYRSGIECKIVKTGDKFIEIEILNFKIKHLVWLIGDFYNIAINHVALKKKKSKNDNNRII